MVKYQTNLVATFMACTRYDGTVVMPLCLLEAGHRKIEVTAICYLMAGSTITITAG
jgi:hypothetical protein